jgi:hypothetical protein
MESMLERSAQRLGENCDWQVLLEQYGYGSVPKNRSEGE